jgi:hypothetical protein
MSGGGLALESSHDLSFCTLKSRLSVPFSIKQPGQRFKYVSRGDGDDGIIVHREQPSPLTTVCEHLPANAGQGNGTVSMTFQAELFKPGIQSTAELCNKQALAITEASS